MINIDPWIYAHQESPDLDEMVEVVLDGGIRDWLRLDAEGNWYKMGDFFKKEIHYDSESNAVTLWKPMETIPQLWGEECIMGDGACCHYCRKYNCICPDEIPDEDEIVKRLTLAMREADRTFERVGGSTKHHVRDCLIPVLDKYKLKITLI